MHYDSDPIIELARSEDVPNIVACARAAYAPYVDRMGIEPAPMVANFADQVSQGLVYVLASKESLFGYVVFYPRDDHLHLENIAVLPSHSGLGMGGRLIAFVENEASRRGLAAVELYTNEKMVENLLLYPKLGYQEIKRDTENGFHRVYFRKPVQ